MKEITRKIFCFNVKELIHNIPNNNNVCTYVWYKHIIGKCKLKYQRWREKYPKKFRSKNMWYNNAEEKKDHHETLRCDYDARSVERSVITKINQEIYKTSWFIWHHYTKKVSYVRKIKQVTYSVKICFCVIMQLVWFCHD